MLLRSLRIGLCLLPLGCSPDEVATGPTSAADTSSSSGGSTGAVTTTTTSTTAPTSGPEPTGTTASNTSSTGETTDPASTTGPTTGSTGPEPSTSAPGTTEAPPSCEDALKNQDETDVDCGGSCSPCLEGQTCALPGDCTSGKCEAGVCAPEGCQSDADCAPLADACNTASCDPNTAACVLTPVMPGEPCDDGDACTTVDTCLEGQCVGAAPVDCAALDSFCGVGVCDPQTGTCALAGKDGMEGMPCDDGFVCTPEDVCSAGICGPGDPGYWLFQDWSAGLQGWTLGETWQVGAAKPSKKAPTGEDPAWDHSPGDDNRLAGALIGDLIAGPAVPKTCLTSPPVDTTLGKTAWLTFWRHLHTDYFPFVTNQIEVFDGVDWVELEVGYNNPGINDPNWQQFFFDLLDYSNEALQIRICYARMAAADPFAGWSVDDITIGPYVCTPE